MKIIVLSIFAILAARKYAHAFDMIRCAQLAITNGVPELKIPSHNPLVLKQNLTLNIPNFLGGNLTYETSKITWNNIPWWKVINDVVTKNTSEVLDRNGAFLWDNFTITYDYNLRWNVKNVNGHVEHLYNKVTWTADWEETKPDKDGVRKINYLNLKQKYFSRSVKATGFGKHRVAGENLLLALNDIINDVFINDMNIYGTALKNSLNTVWYGQPAIYNKLVKWCEDHNITSLYHY